MNYILVALIAISQLIIFPGLSFRWAKEVSAQLLIVASLSWLIWKKNKWLSMFIMWCLILFMSTKSLVIKDDANGVQFNINVFTLLNMLNIILYGIFYYILREIKIDRKLIYKTFCFVGIFQAVYVILQCLQIDQFFFHIGEQPGVIKRWGVGLWANEALVSWCIAICSPFFLAFKELRFKIGYWVCFIALLFTRCSTGIIGFIFGGLFWLYFKNKRLAIIITITLLLICLGMIASGKFAYYFNEPHRFKIWAKTLQIWKGAPLTGWGLGSYRQLFQQLAPEFSSSGHWAQAHNEYIQILFETGIIGFGLFMALIFTTILKFIRNRVGIIPFTSLLIFGLVALTGFPLHTAHGVLVIMALVLYERQNECQDEEVIL